MCGLWKAGGTEAIMRGIKTGFTLLSIMAIEMIKAEFRDVPDSDEFWKPLSQKRLQRVLAAGKLLSCRSQVVFT